MFLTSKNIRISSLDQGSNFNDMQEKIINRSLSCIEKQVNKTIPKEQVIESLENMNKKKPLKCKIDYEVVLNDNPSIGSAPLGDKPGQQGYLLKKINKECETIGEYGGKDTSKYCGKWYDGTIVTNKNWCKMENDGSLEEIDKSEFKYLDELETKFTKKLNEYKQLYQMRNEYLIGNVTKCVPTGKHGSGWEGSCTWAGRQYRDNNSYYKDYKCGEIYGPTYCKDQSLTNDITNKLSLLHSQLTKLSKEMWKRTQKIHSADTKIQVQIENNRKKLNDSMRILESHRNNFLKIHKEQSTLDGKLQSNKNKLDSEHTLYLAWFVLASAFGGFAIFKALR